MLNFNIQEYRSVFNAAVNILAVEYLVKRNDREQYSKYLEILYTFDDIDMAFLEIDLSLNKHIENLGCMITQGNYDCQKEILLSAIKNKKKENDEYHG